MTNLQNILEPFHIRGCRELPNDKYDDCKKTRAEAQAAIAELVDKCIGPDETGFDKYGSMCTFEQHEEITHRNKLKAEIRNNLKAKGII